MPEKYGPMRPPYKEPPNVGTIVKLLFLFCPCVRSELLGKHLLVIADLERKASVTRCKTTC